MPPKKKSSDGAGTPGAPPLKKVRRGSASGATTPSVDEDRADRTSLTSPSHVSNDPGSDAAFTVGAGSPIKATVSNTTTPALSIDTSDVGMAPSSTLPDNSETNDVNGTSSSGKNSMTSNTTRAMKTPPGTGMDSHPYARGAVIEVLHGIEEKGLEEDGVDNQRATSNASDDEWWEQDSSSEEDENEGDVDDDDGADDDRGDGDKDDDDEDEDEDEDDDDGRDRDESKQGESNDDDDDDNDDNSNKNADNVANQQTSLDTKQKKRKKRNDKPHVTVRLCDIIDRVAIGDSKYRYYVHYRDFNRRMDEWISMSRIVSPPSVGNAKARAIKREEEKKKKQQLREQEKKVEDAVDVSAPRASRRRSTLHAPQPGSGAADHTLGGSGGTPGEGEDGGTMRRRRRRTGVDSDDATVVAGNQGEGGPGNATESSGPIMAAEKGVVALPTAVVAQVGEHVVQTIEAQELDEHEGLDEASLREHEEVTKVKNVAFLELGPFQMETWYFSPLPKEVLSENGFIEVLYVCEFTFQMFARKSELRRFQSRLPTSKRHPPGNEIYRHGNLSMFEVDGFEERIYCQNLCYIAKLFLDHKTLYFDVDPFLFYVLCEVDERGFHPVGYYSKEKYSDVGYNLACILTFPSHQRKGYGRFLIAFSYELSKKEEKVGSPEKPMSDLGQQAYKPYWASTIVDFLLNQCPDARSMSIMDISKTTSIMAEDIVFTLNQLGILKIINGVYFIAAEEGLLKTLAKKYPVKEPRVDASKLHWTPFMTDVKRDKFSIHSKKPSVEGEETRGAGGFP